MEWLNKVICGDVLQGLPLPDGCVQTCVTSPPYWGLRDYGVAGQIGLEATPEEYVTKMVQVFREVRRVLRPDGTCWINLGDSYASSSATGNGGWDGNNKNPDGTPRKSRQAGDQWSRTSTAVSGIKIKDMVGIPWMVAFALRSDGWYLRSDIIWAKPNPMPESVTDRPTKAHEYLFLLAKSERYFYDAEAIREERTTLEGRPDGIVRDREWGYDSKQAVLQGRKQDQVGNRTYTGFNERWQKSHSFARKVNEQPGPGQPKQHRENREDISYCNGRNKRTVWTIPTQPFSGAHFACYPEKLVEPCILAGSSPKACPVCGAPWKRTTKKGDLVIVDERGFQNSAGKAPDDGFNRAGAYSEGRMQRGKAYQNHTTGWAPTCSCPNNDGSGRCIILDPFMGSGTTALVAFENGRDYVGIEINPEYVEMANRRLGKAICRERMFV